MGPFEKNTFFPPDPLILLAFHRYWMPRMKRTLENVKRYNIDHEAASPYTIHTAVLPEPSLIKANVNSAITAMLDIVQPNNDDVDEDATHDKVLPHEKYAPNRPIIPVSRESNEPIVKWTDNKTLLTGAFLDKFLFGQGVPIGLPTQRNWKHFSLYYDG